MFVGVFELVEDGVLFFVNFLFDELLLKDVLFWVCICSFCGDCFCFDVCGFKFIGEFLVEEFFCIKIWLLFLCFIVCLLRIDVFLKLVLIVGDDSVSCGVCLISVGEVFFD